MPWVWLLVVLLILDLMCLPESAVSSASSHSAVVTVTWVSASKITGILPEELLELDDELELLEELLDEDELLELELELLELDDELELLELEEVGYVLAGPE